jgi:hypothetical protein
MNHTKSMQYRDNKYCNAGFWHAKSKNKTKFPHSAGDQRELQFPLHIDNVGGQGDCGLQVFRLALQMYYELLGRFSHHQANLLQLRCKGPVKGAWL